MKIPESFPEGCFFVASFGGDEFVRFPDGRVFRLADDGEHLREVGDLPRMGAPMSEEAFLICASDLRAFHQRRQSN